MSIEERHNLLTKLKSQSSLSDEPLYLGENETIPTEDIEVEYNKIPWYYRLWYYILSLFKTKPPVKIFEDNQVAALGAKIDEISPGLYDSQKNLLLPVFYQQIEKLKEAAHFFYTALDVSVNRDRGAFFSFLGSLEMPEVHKRLSDETDPSTIAGRHQDMPESDLRQVSLRAMDDALIMVTEDHRDAMYSNARSLNCLKELSSFLYDRVIMAFDFNSTVNGDTCSAGVVRDLLMTLNNTLFSLRVVPQIALLQSLFVFLLQERAGDHGFDISLEIRSLLLKADDALAVIRKFNQLVPLTLILRCSTRNMTYSPREISGGEDWFSVYRDYWRRRIEAVFAEYLKERRQRELLEAFRLFLKGKSLKFLENTQTDTNQEGMPIKGAFALSFLNTFYSAVFMPEINFILRPILIDGDFQRKENRIEFTEGYNNLIKLDDEIKKFEREISLSGEYGKRYMQARQEIASLPIKRRKIQIVIDDAQEDADKILGRAREASQIMVNILGGILGRDTRSKYLSLTNLPKISGKDNKFINGVGDVIQQFKKVLKLLDDIEVMESGS